MRSNLAFPPTLLGLWIDLAHTSSNEAYQTTSLYFLEPSHDKIGIASQIKDTTLSILVHSIQLGIQAHWIHLPTRRDDDSYTCEPGLWIDLPAILFSKQLFKPNQTANTISGRLEARLMSGKAHSVNNIT